MKEHDAQHEVAVDALDHLDESTASATSDDDRAVFAALKEGLCVLEMISSDDEPADYRFVEVNAAFETATGLRDVMGRTYRELMPQVSILAPESYARIVRTGTPERFVADSEAPGGHQRFDVYAFRLGNHDSQRVAVHFTGVTQRALTEDELVDRSEQLSSLIARAPIGVFLVDAAFRLVHVNPVAEAVFGDVPDLLHRDFEEVVRLMWREDLAEDVIRAFRRTLETGASNAEADLAAMPAERTALVASEEHDRTVFEEMDQAFCVVQVRFDAANAPQEELQQSVLQLRHWAHHDQLTGLPNRLLFDERLQLAVAEAARYGRRLAVLFIDVDGFKEIDDRHGHACGDVVLKTVAQRLQDAPRTSDTLARLHGDEFVVLLPDIGDGAGIASLASTLLEEVAQPVDVDDATVSVTASVGVSLYPRNARQPHGLLHTADAAMYQAKAGGRNNVRFFGSLVPAA